MKAIVLALLLASSLTATTVTLTGNEVSYQPINNLVVTKGGIAFTFSDPTVQDYYDSGDGGQEKYVQDPCIAEGPTSSPFTVSFSVPIWTFHFGIALSTQATLATAVTVSLYNTNYEGGTVPFAVQTTSGKVYDTFTEGYFSYDGSLGPVTKILVTPNTSAGAFGFDNLTVTTVPPSTLTLTMDEVVFQPINGLTVWKGGMEFSFADTTGADYDAGDGGNELYTQDPVIEGQTAGEAITVGPFSVPVYSVRFGVALSTEVPVDPMGTLYLYNNSTTPFATITANTLVCGTCRNDVNTFADGEFTYTGGPVTEMKFVPNSSQASAFGFDNLAVSPTPDDGIAVGPNSEIYAVDGANNRVRVYDGAGAFLLTFGSLGKGNGQFILPTGIALVTNGNAVSEVLVSDAGNNRVQAFDSSGNYLWQFGSTGTGNGEFQQPLGIAVLPGGDIAVVDSANQRVQIFNARGNYLSQFGSPGNGNGQFFQPAGIAVTPEGLIAVADSWNSRIELFDTSGHYKSQFGSMGTGNGQFIQPTGVASFGVGLAVTDSGNNRVQVFNASNTFQFRIGSPGSGAGQFSSPGGIGAFGLTMWVLDQGNDRLQGFSYLGSFLNQASLN